MIHFNEEAVKYGVSMCKSKPHYKARVAVTQAHLTEAFEAIYSAIDGEDCTVHKNSAHMDAIFPNGSYIRTIPATANSRGYRAHLMIVDDYADREIIKYVLHPCEILENLDINWLRSSDSGDNSIFASSNYLGNFYGRYYASNGTGTHFDSTIRHDVNIQDEFSMTYLNDTEKMADVSKDEFLKILCAN